MGRGVGAVMAGSLLLMPRLYGQAQSDRYDTPGLLLWAATALAFWKGLHETKARRWRIAVGILLGLAFVEKMAAVTVLLPLMLWLVLGPAAADLRASERGGRWDWIDGVLTTARCSFPWAWLSSRSRSCKRQLPPPKFTDLFVNRPASDWPGAILAIPLAIWLVRRLLGWVFPRHRIWGVERRGLETWTAILAFAPIVGWLGNPAWWRETLPRLAHYYNAQQSFRPAGITPEHSDHLFRPDL